MKQQINLYQPIFRRQKKVFSAVAMLQICGFFLVTFAAIYLIGQAKLQPLHDQLARQETDLALLRAQLLKLEQRNIEPGSKLIENEINRLTLELAKRKQVQSLLTRSSFGSTQGFSGYLEAFARQHVQGIWLRNIFITDGGGEFGLEGGALSSELVPEYIDRLSGESLLQGRAINVMELVKPEQPAGQFEFFVSTTRR